MVQRLTLLLSAVTVSAPAFPRRLAIHQQAIALRGWLFRHREAFLIAALLLIAAVAHGYNMFHFPYVENDEGTYMSQAWSTLSLGELAPYTYWYDHAPLGWLQIVIWTVLTGGLHTFGASADSGRVLMLLMQVGSTAMLYVIARRISGSVVIGVAASLLFALSPFGIYFHRRVLLDNICTFWMLLSIMLLLSPRLTLTRVWLSALTLGISVLSKELTIFLVPVMAYLVYYRTHRSQRAFATIGWLVITFAILSLYVLMAVLKGELFPSGTFLGGKANHVSLLGTLQYQAQRGKDGGALDAHSSFRHWLGLWLVEEPMLVIGGGIATALCTLLIWRRRLVGIMGLLTLSLIAFLARGGEVIEFYLVPYLPLLALNIALVVGVGAEAIQFALRRLKVSVATYLGYAVRGVGALLCVFGILHDFTDNWQGLSGDHLIFFHSTQADAQVLATNWVKTHIPGKSSIVIDDYGWTDLHDGSPATTSSAQSGPVYNRADWYWKLDRDPAIQRLVPNWRKVDYVVTTSQLLSDMNVGKLKTVKDVVAHSVLIAHYDTGGWPVNVRKVVHPGQQAPLALDSGPAIPGTTQIYLAGGMNTDQEHTSITLLNPEVQSSSIHLKFIFADGTIVDRIVDIDPSTQRSIAVSDIEPQSGAFGLIVTADRKITASMTVHRDGTRGDTLIVSKGLGTNWALSEGYTGLIARETLSILNPDTSRPAHVTLQYRSLSGASQTDRALTVAPHSTYLVPLLPTQALAITATSDQLVAIERAPIFSAAGYNLIKGSNNVAAADWSSTKVGVAENAHSYLSLSSPSCSATLSTNPAASSANGTLPDNSSLVAASCRSTVKLDSFLRASGVATAVSGGRRALVQPTFANSPDDTSAPTGVVFGPNVIGR